MARCTTRERLDPATSATALRLAPYCLGNCCLFIAKCFQSAYYVAIAGLTIGCIVNLILGLRTNGTGHSWDILWFLRRGVRYSKLDADSLSDDYDAKSLNSEPATIKATSL